MPGRLDSCTKIFVGNFDPNSPIDEIRDLFAKYGEVVECDIVRNFCFVHMANEKEAHTAIEALNGFTFNGRRLNVEESISEVRQKPGMGGSDKCFFCGDGGHWSRDCPKRGPGGRNQTGRSTKIYVGNVTETTTEEELREMFAKYGTVTECAKVKNYAFVHMKSNEEAENAIENLKGHTLNGNTLTIEASSSRPKARPSASTPIDRYSARVSSWDGLRGADRSSMLRGADPYALTTSLRSAYARERSAPYPSSAYLGRYDDRYLDRERYDRMRAAMVENLYDRRVGARASGYERYADRYDTYSREYLAAAAAAAAASSPTSASSRAAVDYYSARSAYPSSALPSSSSRSYDYSGRY
ncbi:unnamed protein product [Notodromas monacha]|uniref:RNA-binding protein 4 n=1 Tax=Notodromas monacha TaxID=399045 RepID=A0A7R9BTT7_9CRUS|nr:unnamed protein product [Notodromas monacha]CAG0920556.1 unnamed protein product [Notodromas monacha]